MRILIELTKLLAIDFVFVGVLILALIPLFRVKRAAYAVAKRNFTKNNIDNIKNMAA